MSDVSELLAALGRQIRAARSEAGLTQTELGQRAGITGKYVSEIERGTREVPLRTLQAIVSALKLHLHVTFERQRPARDSGPHSLPRHVEDVARGLVRVPAQRRAAVLAIVRSILRVVG
jgi:transcriptional regulator with XRE-family HTH domain